MKQNTNYHMYKYILIHKHKNEDEIKGNCHTHILMKTKMKYLQSLRFFFLEVK